MAKSQKQSKPKSQTMLGQKTGSMLDIKTNEDFNNEHPKHDDSGLIDGGSPKDDLNRNTITKQTSDKRKPELKLKKNSK